MTKAKKLDIVIKIMTVFNNAMIAASFLLAASVIPIGLMCSIGVYLFIGLILAYSYRTTQHLALTTIFWLPAMSFQKVTEWISR